MTPTILAAATGVLVGWGMRSIYGMFQQSDRTSNRREDKR